MPHDPLINPRDILTALQITAVSAITPVHGGADTAIWRIEHGPLISALRVFRPDQADTYQREMEAMEAARQAHIPVPALHASGVWQERPFLLLSWCPGIPLWKAVRRQPWRVWSLGMAFGRTQAQIHHIPTNTHWRHLRADWIEWAGPQQQRLQTMLQQIADPTPALLHLDYHPQNVLTDGTGITAVLDWANVRIGDPRADIARTYTILVVEPRAPDRRGFFLALLRRLLMWSWWQGYKRAAGRPADMAWFYVWAGAVMVHDLAPRASDPHSWWQPHDLEHIQNWTTMWRQRAENRTSWNRGL